MRHFLFEEGEYRYRPVWKPPGRRAEDRSGLRYLRRLLRGGRNKARHIRPAPVRDTRQRCVVKTHYSRSVEAHLAQLRAYLTREGTSREGGKAELFGTDIEEYKENMVSKNWRIILSPESREVDLRAFAESFVKGLEADTGYKFRWEGAAHYNTEHPHAHLLINGRDKAGREVEFPPDMIRKYMREAARDRCTALAGARSYREVAAEREAELTAARATGIDRHLEKRVIEEGGRLKVHLENSGDGYFRYIKRLDYLVSLELAEKVPGGYEMRPGWESELRNIGRYNVYLDAKRTVDRGIKLYDPSMGRLGGRIEKIYKTDEISNNHAVVLRSGGGEAYLVPLFRRPRVREGDEVVMSTRADEKGRLSPDFRLADPAAAAERRKEMKAAYQDILQSERWTELDQKIKEASAGGTVTVSKSVYEYKEEVSPEELAERRVMRRLEALCDMGLCRFKGDTGDGRNAYTLLNCWERELKGSETRREGRTNG